KIREMPYRQYCGHLRYVSHDLSWIGTGKGKVGLQPRSWDTTKVDIVSDITTIPLPDNSFDAILCTEVLEHIVEPREAIEEFSRILKKGGLLIVTAPFCSITHFAPQFYYTGFSPFFYKKVLPNCGFRIKQIKPNGSYYEFLAQEALRLDKIVRKISKVRFSYIDHLVRLLFVKLLYKLATIDLNNCSSTVLCFDYFVLAVKK
ncbi:class I SAM-dependent methyltransferase, partial [Patescibacteria group bacterium]|nr:class I SAM-dependent methyltransferase [Patescibacteria group bacterium]